MGVWLGAFFSGALQPSMWARMAARLFFTASFHKFKKGKYGSNIQNSIHRGKG
jgi:hypothetical protein